MERHIAKRLGIPCAVISAPVHVQDFPARYSPQMGFEGANVIFDTWVHPLMMGLEEHLLTMFREDFEFNDAATPSHLGTAVDKRNESLASNVPAPSLAAAPGAPVAWAPDAEQELHKVPFFVRARPAAIPRDSPGNTALQRSPSRHFTMPKRTSAVDQTSIRVVIVTLDGHLAGAAERARPALEQELPGLSLSLHAATEWADDPQALERCRTAIAAGDIIVATMLFWKTISSRSFPISRRAAITATP